MALRGDSGWRQEKSQKKKNTWTRRFPGSVPQLQGWRDLRHSGRFRKPNRFQWQGCLWTRSHHSSTCCRLQTWSSPGKRLAEICDIFSLFQEPEYFRYCLSRPWLLAHPHRWCCSVCTRRGPSEQCYLTKHLRLVEEMKVFTYHRLVHDLRSLDIYRFIEKYKVTHNWATYPTVVWCHLRGKEYLERSSSDFSKSLFNYKFFAFLLVCGIVVLSVTFEKSDWNLLPVRFVHVHIFRSPSRSTFYDQRVDLDLFVYLTQYLTYQRHLEVCTHALGHVGPEPKHLCYCYCFVMLCLLCVWCWTWWSNGKGMIRKSGPRRR